MPHNFLSNDSTGQEIEQLLGAQRDMAGKPFWPTPQTKRLLHFPMLQFQADWRDFLKSSIWVESLTGLECLEQQGGG